MEANVEGAWARLDTEVLSCIRCPRLVEWRELVAREKRRAYRDWTYWGKPLCGFGDHVASLLVLGLAPAAHGGNRTGRVFTGDRSGDFLFGSLYRTGFANQPLSVQRDDGLRLRHAYITAAVRCAPPANRPTPSEANNCRSYLHSEWALLTPTLRVVVTLGHFALAALWQLLREQGHLLPKLKPAHGGVYDLGSTLPRLIFSYHPSQQNTQTGRLSPDMLDRVFDTAQDLIDREATCLSAQ